MSDKVVIVRNPFSTLPNALTVIEDPKLPSHVFVLRTEKHEVLVDAKNGTMRKRKRLKFEPITYGTLMTWRDFCESVACGGIDDEDGSGEFATATEVSNIPVSVSAIYDRLHNGGEDADIAAQRLKPPHEWVTHVLWCNT